MHLACDFCGANAFLGQLLLLTDHEYNGGFSRVNGDSYGFNRVVVAFLPPYLTASHLALWGVTCAQKSAQVPFSKHCRRIHALLPREFQKVYRASISMIFMALFSNIYPLQRY